MNDKPLGELVESIITGIKSQHSQIHSQVGNNVNGTEDKSDVVSIQSASTGKRKTSANVFSKLCQFPRDYSVKKIPQTHTTTGHQRQHQQSIPSRLNQILRRVS